MIDGAGNQELALAADFPQVGETQWRALVEKVLNGADIERLGRVTADEIKVRPLYTATDAAAREGLPGAAPFTRGASAAGTVAGGWDIRQRHVVLDAALANAAILDDLEGGVTSIQLRLETIPDRATLDRALADVLLDVAPIGLDARAAHVAVASSFLELARQRGLAGAPFRADLNVDPLGAAVAGDDANLQTGLGEAVALARTVAADWPGTVTLVADGRPYHCGGASEGQEVAFAVATGITYLRELAAASVPVGAAARQIGFAFATDADFFLSLAKFRALRRLWGRVLDVAQAGSAMADLRLHAETAPRSLTRLDPHVNILRGAVSAFAAAAGGATSITVLPFDHALGPPAPLARRVARNTQLVLLEESNLGRVIDPAGGSWFAEQLTEEFAAKAWLLVQKIERRGGMLEALRLGWPQELVAESREKRAANIATRRELITGVSEFADLAEPPHATPAPSTADAGLSSIRAIPFFRLAEGFERLRASSDAFLARTGDRPRVFLGTLGRQDEFAARATFARNLFEAGGFAILASGALSSVEDLAHVFKTSGARQAVICSSDANYAAAAEPAARALRNAHAVAVYLMGRPEEAQRDAWRAAGVDEFVYDGADVLAMLERAQALEAARAA